MSKRVYLKIKKGIQICNLEERKPDTAWSHRHRDVERKVMKGPYPMIVKSEGTSVKHFFVALQKSIEVAC